MSTLEKLLWGIVGRTLPAFVLAAGASLASAGAETFSFAVLGDYQNGSPVYEEIVQRVIEAEPDFVLFAGDMVDYGKDLSDWEDFVEKSRLLLEHAPSDGLTTYVYPTIGNHELFPDFDHRYLENYFAVFDVPPVNQEYYSFDYKNAHFVSLFLYQENMPSGWMGEGSEMHTWFVEDMREADENQDSTWKFVFFHTPVFCCTNIHCCSSQVQQAVMPALNEYDATAVFNGHSHSYQRFGPLRFFTPDPEGVSYIISSGCGARMYQLQREDGNTDSLGSPCDRWYGPHAPVMPRCELQDFHYVMISVDAGRVTGAAHRPDGSIIEEFVVRGDASFSRGDTNQDGRLNIADSVCVLGHLFSPEDTGSEVLLCLDAADSNDDGRVNIADAIYNLTHLFGGGAPPPEPTSCGSDATPDMLGCVRYECR